MGYNLRQADLSAVKVSLALPNFLLKIIPQVDGSPRVCSKTAFLKSSSKVEPGDLRGRPKHRSSCSTVEDDLVADASMDGSALQTIDALGRCDAISKAPSAATALASFSATQLPYRTLASMRVGLRCSCQ